MRQPLKQYVVRKYVKARSVAEAFRLEKRYPAEEIDEDWKKAQETTRAEMGFVPKAHKINKS